jgi:hypothetical protein
MFDPSAVQNTMLNAISFVAVTTAIIVTIAASFVLFRRITVQSHQEKQNKIKEEQRNLVRYALEVFQPFYWEALHFAILSEEFKRKQISTVEKSEERNQLITGYLTAFNSLQEQAKSFEGKSDVIQLQSAVPIDLREEVEKLVRVLGDVCRVAQEKNDLQECFSLVEIAYRDSSHVEKTLRSLYRRG